MQSTPGVVHVLVRFWRAHTAELPREIVVSALVARRGGGGGAGSGQGGGHGGAGFRRDAAQRGEDAVAAGMIRSKGCISSSMSKSWFRQL